MLEAITSIFDLLFTVVAGRDVGSKAFDFKSFFHTIVVFHSLKWPGMMSEAFIIIFSHDSNVSLTVVAGRDVGGEAFDFKSFSHNVVMSHSP